MTPFGISQAQQELDSAMQGSLMGIEDQREYEPTPKSKNFEFMFPPINKKFNPGMLFPEDPELDQLVSPEIKRPTVIPH